MNVTLAPGTYVIAVSGGVDSMVLLDLLAGDTGFEPRKRQWRLSVELDAQQAANAEATELIIAHYDHGIRPDSAEDRRLVQATAKRLGLPFVYKEGKLGADASEALAREQRYAFLREVQAQHNATAIVTAHHQDDLLETMLLNLLRGTGRRGLSSLRSRPGLLRPLLGVPKAEIVAYARQHQLAWREDSTNQDPRYRRNQIRQTLMPRLTPTQRAQLLAHAASAATANDEIDTLLAELLATQPDLDTLDRQWFTQLPQQVARELLVAWLLLHEATFDRRGVERLVAFSKTAASGKLADVDRRYQLRASKKHITLRRRSGEQ